MHVQSPTNDDIKYICVVYGGNRLSHSHIYFARNLRLDTRESECILGNAIDASAVLKLNSLGSFVSGPLFRFNRFPGTRR